MNDETRFRIGFSVFPGIGPVRFKLLLEFFGSARAAWDASSRELRDIKLGETLVTEFDHFRRSFDLDEYIKRLELLRVRVLAQDDPKYPPLLKELTDAPFLLYVKGKKGDQPINLKRTIAVVGTRRVTSYGVEVTKRIVSELVSCGFTIVSGLAYGVDAIAHQTAIDCGGKTIAVLGCGIDIIAPPSNARLYRAIGEEGFGAIVSEMPLGLRPNKGLFPARNRIISGLSLGVLVTEGADDSGALITARNAAEQGREVFAVPGPITSVYSKGPAKLIKQGATLVESAQDILDELNIHLNKPIHESNFNKRINKLVTTEEKKIVEILEDRRMDMSELVRVTSLTSAVVAATITILEMKGIIKDFGDKEYGLQ